MKLARISRETLDGPVARLAVVQLEQNRVIDLASAEQARLMRTGADLDAAKRLATALYPASMSAAIAAGPTFLSAAARTADSVEDAASSLPMDSVQWLSPIDPPLMRDCMAFERHVLNSMTRVGRPVAEQYYQMPIYYKGNPLTLIGHETEVPWPGYTQKMDYEMELGMVIGRSGRDLTPDNALEHLLGLTVFGDYSARDIQMQEMAGMLGPSKGKDFATAIGPWIVTLDEFKDFRNLTMTVRVNGEERSSGSSGTIMWQLEEIIAYMSKSEGVRAGELIGSGTVGWGCGMELNKLLNPGDMVELEIGGIGTLRNRVGQPQPQGWMPTQRVPSKE